MARSEPLIALLAFPSTPKPYGSLSGILANGKRDSPEVPEVYWERTNRTVHERRLMRDYISNYHTERIPDSLGKDTPAMRIVSSKPHPSATVVSFPRVSGLHYGYDWHQTA